MSNVRRLARFADVLAVTPIHLVATIPTVARGSLRLEQFRACENVNSWRELLPDSVRECA